jgi:hypothetical protein
MKLPGWLGARWANALQGWAKPSPSIKLWQMLMAAGASPITYSHALPSHDHHHQLLVVICRVRWSTKTTLTPVWWWRWDGLGGWGVAGPTTEEA